MKITAIIPKTKTQPERFLIEVTEKELDKLSGITDAIHIAGRYKVDVEIVVADVYNKLQWLKENKAALIKVPAKLRETAESIEKLLPKG